MNPGPQGWRGLDYELTLPGTSSQGRPREPPCGCAALLPHGHCGHSLTQQAAHSEGGCGRTPCSVPAVRDPSGAPQPDRDARARVLTFLVSPAVLPALGGPARSRVCMVGDASPTLVSTSVRG